MGLSEVDNNGVGLFNFYSGLMASSTRQEIIGAIMSLMPNGPVHVGIDSFACLKRLWVYISGSYEDTLPKQPWMLIPHKDLWEMFTVRSMPRMLNQFVLRLSTVMQRTRTYWRGKALRGLNSRTTHLMI